MIASQQGQSAARELSGQEVYNYFYPRSIPGWMIAAIVVGVILVPVGILVHFFLLSVAGPVGAAISVFSIYKLVKSNPDDESYDAWVERQASELYTRGLQMLALRLNRRDDMLIIQSYVLPGSQDANDYLENEVLMKEGKDGQYRFSINVYTYIFCTANYLAVFKSDINVFDPIIHIDMHEMYGYRHIVNATTIPQNDMLLYEGEKVPYRTEQFCLKITTGENLAFSAAVKAGPRRNMPGGPRIWLPDTGYDRTLSRLRQILFSHQ